MAQSTVPGHSNLTQLECQTHPSTSSAVAMKNRPAEFLDLPNEIIYSIISELRKDADDIAHFLLGLTCWRIYAILKRLYPEPICMSRGWDLKGLPIQWNYALAYHVGEFLGPAYRPTLYNEYSRYKRGCLWYGPFLPTSIYGDTQAKNDYVGRLMDWAAPNSFGIVLPSPFRLGAQWYQLVAPLMYKVERGYELKVLKNRWSRSKRRASPENNFRTWEKCREIWRKWQGVGGAYKRLHRDRRDRRSLAYFENEVCFRFFEDWRLMNEKAASEADERSDARSLASAEKEDDLRFFEDWRLMSEEAAEEF